MRTHPMDSHLKSNSCLSILTISASCLAVLESGILDIVHVSTLPPAEASSHTMVTGVAKRIILPTSTFKTLNWCRQVISNC